jgi:hypothetical protein
MFFIVSVILIFIKITTTTDIQSVYDEQLPVKSRSGR